MKQILLIFVFSVSFLVKGECQFDSIELNKKFIYLQQQTDSLQAKVSHMAGEKRQITFATMMPWLLTCATIFISVMIYKRDVSYRNVSFVTESNKMKITDPTLWAFYDTYKQDYDFDILITQSTFQINGAEEFNVKSSGKLTINGIGTMFLNGNQLDTSIQKTFAIKTNDKIKCDGNLVLSLSSDATISVKGIESKKIEGKVRAYCYFNLNSFELVFNNNQITGSSNVEWEDYMINSMIDSNSFYKIVKKESAGYLYTKKYREKLKDFIAIADICKSKKSEEIFRIIESKSRILLAYKSGLIKEPYDYSGMKNYLNEA